MRIVRRLIGAVLVVYLLCVAGLAYAMFQPPEAFGQVMKHVPMALFPVLPFERIWMLARDGALAVGDEAPDFDLRVPDGSRRVRLSDFRGQRPVVLVFGSYT